MPSPSSRSTIGTGVIEASLDPEGFDFMTADRWHVLVLHRGRPAARVDLASPGTVSGDALIKATLHRRADRERSRAALLGHLRSRLGGKDENTGSLRVSVVVCTHRRSQYLPDLLKGLRSLDPAPFEVIVVDNDPGEEDCRQAVEEAGFRYLRQDLRGLDNARNAGLRAARGDVIAFTDDDVVPPPGWLGVLDRAFAHEGVAAVTGPAFPYLLDTPARVRAERQASLTRGLRRLAFDVRVVSPLGAGSMGVGANMVLRRDRLLELGPEPFPPELDAGTETESGGDTYVIARLIALGGQVIYDPELFVFHQHRPNRAALTRAVFGYGVGISSLLAKQLVEHGEVTVPRSWSWLVKQYFTTQRRRIAGRADATETGLSCGYLRGGLVGVGRWREALRTQRAARTGPNGYSLAPMAPIAPEVVEPDPEPTASFDLEAGTSPAISVIVPTFRREPTLRRCLDALAAQDLPAGSFEVVVVDDDPDGREERIEADRRHSYEFSLRRVGNSGKGAAAARNQGVGEASAPLLLFIDDDIVPDRWLLRRHLSLHASRDGDRVLIGSCRPRPTQDNLIAVASSLWWQEFFNLLEESRGSTFVGALTGNMSATRSVFERVGRFSEAYSKARREDWEWGLRVRRAGIPIDFDSAASARHEFTLETGDRLRHARSEGRGDTLIVASYPEALATLPLPSMRPVTLRRPVRWAGFWLWRRAPVRRLAILLLDFLEKVNLREAWSRVFFKAQSASYALGALEGGWSHDKEIKPPDHAHLELLSDEPIEAPSVAAQVVRVLLGGEEVARVFPPEGIWAPSFAEQIVDWMKPYDIARAAIKSGFLDVEEESQHRLGQVEVIVGPANPASDLVNRDVLEQAGVGVREVDGDPGRHWELICRAAQEGNRPIVAIPMPGTRPQVSWLLDALPAFDGTRVGLVFGGRLSEGEAPEPLYLHDKRSADAALTLTGQSPAYLVMRRELLSELRPGGGLLGPLLASVQGALEKNWAVGHRLTRGLSKPTYPRRMLGESFGCLRVAEIHGEGGPGLAREALLGFLALGWEAYKGRGRLTKDQRELALGITRGSVQRLRRERRRR